ncbi:MAG: hypothetical protein ACHRHE_24060 [Tepidisphaerales bacterium]
MPTQIPNLWPMDEIAVDVLSPLVILRAQATELERLTQGVLRAEVVSETEGDDPEFETHRLDVIAPAVGNLRRTLATVSHAEDGAYPVSVHGEGKASSQIEFEVLLRRQLASSEVSSTIQSLLAKSNERKRPQPAGKPSEPGTPPAKAT